MYVFLMSSYFIKNIHYNVKNLCMYIHICGDHHVMIITELGYKCVYYLISTCYSTLLKSYVWAFKPEMWVLKLIALVNAKSFSKIIWKIHLLVSICNETLIFFKILFLMVNSTYINFSETYKGFGEQCSYQSLWIIWIYIWESDEILQSPKLCFRQWLKRQPLPMSGVGTEVMMIYDSSLRGLVLRWVTAFWHINFTLSELENLVSPNYRNKSSCGNWGSLVPGEVNQTK